MTTRMRAARYLAAHPGSFAGFQCVRSFERFVQSETKGVTTL